MAYPENPVYSVGDIEDQEKYKWTLRVNGKEEGEYTYV